MDVNSILRSLFGAGKLSTVDALKRMGRSRSYLSAYIAKGNEPGTSLLAEICDAIDYDLIVRNRKDGSEIIITPTAEEE